MKLSARVKLQLQNGWILWQLYGLALPNPDLMPCSGFCGSRTNKSYRRCLIGQLSWRRDPTAPQPSNLGDIWRSETHNP